MAVRPSEESTDSLPSPRSGKAKETGEKGPREGLGDSRKGHSDQ